MLLQAFVHAFVSVTIAELETTAITSNRFHAFSIDSIAGSTTVELIERQELASISGSLLEHHCPQICENFPPTIFRQEKQGQSFESFIFLLQN